MFCRAVPILVEGCFRQPPSNAHATYRSASERVRNPRWLRRCLAHQLGVLQAARAASPSTQVVIITGYASLDSAITAVRLGAYDYLTKPFSLGQIDVVMARVTGSRSRKRIARPCGRIGTREAERAHAAHDRPGAIEARLASMRSRSASGVGADASSSVGGPQAGPPAGSVGPPTASVRFPSLSDRFLPPHVRAPSLLTCPTARSVESALIFTIDTLAFFLRHQSASETCLIGPSVHIADNPSSDRGPTRFT